MSAIFQRHALLTNYVEQPVELSLLLAGTLAAKIEPSDALQVVALDSPMLLLRDAHIISFAAAFKQVTATQIRAVIFDGLSRVPMDRRLKSLCDRDFLAVMKRRAGSGERGGAGAKVYQLGPLGWVYADKHGAYRPSIAVNHHSLAVADSFMAIVEAHKAGQLQLLEGGYLEYKVGSAVADMYVNLGIPAIGKRRSFYLEIEATRKRPHHVLDKCDKYSAAWRSSSDDHFAKVLFVAPDEWVEAELRRVIARHKDKELFQTTTMGKLISDLIRP